LKQAALFIAITLTISLFPKNSFAQENMQNVLKGIWKSNIGTIVQIDGNQGVLLYTTSESWKQFMNKPIIRISERLHYNGWKVEELIKRNGDFNWIEIYWKLENNRIIKHLIYLKDEEDNYYEKISDDLDYEISVIEQNPSSHSSAARFDIAAGIGRMSGDTTYRIGYPVNWVNFGVEEGYFPISQLEFPLDVYLGAIEAGLEADIWKLSLCLQKEITSDAGDMKDSDWITPSDPSRLDIYSASDTQLDALILDLNFLFRFYAASNWSFTAGIGYLREHFEFECRLIRQYSPSGVPGYDAVGDGSVSLTYEITYDIPYLEFGTQYNLRDKIRLQANVGYSPIVQVKDEDHHLLRDKVNKGDLDGEAFLISLAGRYDLFKNFFLALEFDYRKIETDKGDMVATFGGANSIFNHTVTEEVESEQMTTTFKVGYTY
jgi:outer membrane protease